MALSTKTLSTLVVALASKAAATEMVAIITARSGTASPDLQRRLVDVLGRTAGKEVIAALTSGATLSLKASQRVIIAMAGDGTPKGGPHAAGNEMINFIQSTPNAKNITI